MKCRLGHDVLGGAHIHIGVHFIGFPNFLTSWISGLDLCLRHLSCGRSGAAEDSLQVQWYSEDVTHQHIGMVSHVSCIGVIDAGAWMCHFLNVAMGRSVFFAVHLQVLPTGDVFIVRRLRIQLTLRRMQLLTRNPTVASLIFDASLHVCTEWVIASTASEVMMLF